MRALIHVVVYYCFFLMMFSKANAQPKLFLPLNELFDPPVNAYFDTNPAKGKVSKYDGPVPDMCSSWDNDAETLMCIGKTYDGHGAVDYNVPNLGEKGYYLVGVFSAAGGIVTAVLTGQMKQLGCGCYGNYVKIDHGDGLETIYAHLSSVNSNIKVGQWVNVHDSLGFAGTTGDSSGEHLHFEVRLNGIAVDPYSNMSMWCGAEPQFFQGEECDSDKPRWHPAGTILHVEGKPEYFLLGENGYLSHILNEMTYFGNGYAWNQAIAMTSTEKECYVMASSTLSTTPTYGMIAHTSLMGIEYWFYFGQYDSSVRYRRKVHAKGALAVAKSWGLSQLPTSNSSSDTLYSSYPVAQGYQPIRNGTLFREEGNSEVYAMENGKRRWVQNWDTFTYAGYANAPILVADAGSMQYVGGLIGAPLSYTNFNVCMKDSCAGGASSLGLLCPNNTTIDADLDQFALAFDCDDIDPKRFPNNTELCDKIDNNCNGAIDENNVCGLDIAVVKSLCETLKCNDANPCTDDWCDEQIGCTTVANSTACANDFNACTNDVCVNGVCSHPPISAFCDDGDMCTVSDSCKNGVCAGGTFICECVNAGGCNDNNVCTNDTCVNGQCWFVANVNVCATDNNPCTNDVCVQGGCTHPFNKSACSDANVCTQNDVCSVGKCAGIPSECIDTNPCTNDWCNAETGKCQSSPNANSCDDGNPNTKNDSCTSGGQCKGTKFTTCDCDHDCTLSDQCMVGTCANKVCAYQNVCQQSNVSLAECDKVCKLTSQCLAGVFLNEQCVCKNACSQSDTPAEPKEPSPPQIPVQPPNDQPIPTAQNGVKAKIILTWDDPTISSFQVVDLIGCVGLAWDGLGIVCSDLSWQYTNLFSCIQFDSNKFECEIDVEPGRNVWFNIQFYPPHDYGLGYLETYACGMDGLQTGNVDTVDVVGKSVVSKCVPDAYGNFNMMLKVVGDETLINAGGLLNNGSFEMGVESWFPEIYEWGSAQMDLDCTDAFDGWCGLKTNVSSSQINAYDVQLVSHTSVVAGKQYLVMFAARSNVERNISIWMGNNSPPWTMYGLNHQYKIGTDWKVGMKVFTALVTDANAKFSFVLGGETGKVWIDAVSIVAL